MRNDTVVRTVYLPASPYEFDRKKKYKIYKEEDASLVMTSHLP